MVFFRFATLTNPNFLENSFRIINNLRIFHYIRSKVACVCDSKHLFPLDRERNFSLIKLRIKEMHWIDCSNKKKKDLHNQNSNDYQTRIYTSFFVAKQITKIGNNIDFLIENCNFHQKFHPMLIDGDYYLSIVWFSLDWNISHLEFARLFSSRLVVLDRQKMRVSIAYFPIFFKDFIVSLFYLL